MTLLYLITTLNATEPHPLERSLDYLTLLKPHNQFIPYHVEDVQADDLIPDSMGTRLGPWIGHIPWLATFSKAEVTSKLWSLKDEMHTLRDDPKSHILPEPLPSLRQVIDNLNSIAIAGKRHGFNNMKVDEKYEKSKQVYEATEKEKPSIKDKVEECIAKINQVLAEAIKQEVYSSEEIEDACAALAVVGDVFYMQDELLDEIQFASRSLDSDPRQVLRAKLRLIRSEYATGELKLPDYEADLQEYKRFVRGVCGNQLAITKAYKDMVKGQRQQVNYYWGSIQSLRDSLGEVYKFSYSDYEKVRSEVYYLLKKIRADRKMTELDLDHAILQAKSFASQLYRTPVVDWRSVVPDIPRTNLINFTIEAARAKAGANTRDVRNGEYPHHQGVLPIRIMHTFPGRVWTFLCETLEEFHEAGATEKTEELYGLLCALSDHSFIKYSTTYLFLPWFDPAKYSRKTRVLHLTLHLMRLASYGPTSSTFSYDLLKSSSRFMQINLTDQVSYMDEAAYYLNLTDQVSCMDEAAYHLYHFILLALGGSQFRLIDNMEKTPGGVVAEISYRGSKRTFSAFQVLYRHLFTELECLKDEQTEAETEIVDLIQTHLLFMLPAIRHRNRICTYYYYKNPDKCKEYLDNPIFTIDPPLTFSETKAD